MKNKLYKFLCFGALVLSIQSCKDSVTEEFVDYSNEDYALITQRLELPQELYDYSSNFESGFLTNNVENFEQRRSNHKATLGRVLFYDKTLSKSETVSCASCHKQELAFADDVAFSEGFDGDITTRNSLPLGNTIGFETSYGSGGGQSAFFAWDESNQDISTQSKAAIISTVEMGHNMQDLVGQLSKDDVYKVLFRKAFGDERIMEHRILESIEEFVNSIVSKNSKFDKQLMSNGTAFKDFNGFTAEENLGKHIYNLKCSTCHSSTHQFTAVSVANNGLDVTYADQGVGAHTSAFQDMGVFKVPFLRNIAKTAPYMHDGRFATLDEVIEHYSSGIQAHDNLHRNLKEPNGEPEQMNFSDQEKSALKAYLLTLTDEEVLTDVRFADPFK